MAVFDWEIRIFHAHFDICDHKIQHFSLEIFLKLAERGSHVRLIQLEESRLHFHRATVSGKRGKKPNKRRHDFN